MVSKATPRTWMPLVTSPPMAQLARMFMSYLAFCPTLSLAGSSSSGLSASSTVSRSNCSGAPI
ncbi:hypothetical protein D3C80_1589400 [compost metagenome]